ncbi:PR domain zinc finger protein 8 isoform X1 [Phyllopteryx taeniolatus]|uniref:PR domain zinc finger protein 8 isoform X1 n=1 Tax=Phyllopteryx taeniolatus TaxID=161469 RepID=UPI002AD3249F|nr:PR domain zinc finger protein 8 isoform X1 [Phyllopteryx taeniolatus]XP_061645539.1 PR domain zinc finger protein 8 isoform X1 [Phyllopteryx taeniolatus]
MDAPKSEMSFKVFASQVLCLTMDHAFVARSMWPVDGKFVQHPTELHTSVVVTRSIPAGTSFGPCVLQHTFYDTIAFIAQKSTDRRSKSCVFRVDPEAMRNSALVLSWLRLVQAARNGEEQNTEAFLKGGQLYVRTTRDVHQEEELLVWYDQELCHLLSFTDTRRGSSEEFKCVRCEQVFKNEYPFLAHCRFLCTQIKSNAWSRDVYDEHKHVEVKRPRRVTDFHNIARDLEHKKSDADDDTSHENKRKYQETVYLKGRKTVLLEKTNISNDDNITQDSRIQDETGGDESDSAFKIKGDRTKVDHLGCKNATFGEAREAKLTITHNMLMDSETGESSGLRLSSGSAFSLVHSDCREQRSAFCKPSKRISAGELHHSSPTTALLSGLEVMRDTFTHRTVSGYSNLMGPSILSGDVHTLPSPVTLNTAFHYTPEHWSRTAQVQSTSALTVLPPTFTSFGVSVQNWCAKCNLSFRMTSDLVFHMRSHHKKEFAAESQVRRRQEEKLTCPICHEYFRERHHLSRHMTSHN